VAYNNTSDISFRVGEKDLLYASFNGVAPATATIAPGSTFTLYDQTNTPVATYNNVQVTGYDAGVSISTGKVWYNLDTSILAPGIYYAVFAYSITGNDNLVRNMKPDLQIQIFPVVEMVATFDLTTIRGQIRLWSRDIDMLNPINSDLEIDSCMYGGGYFGLGADTFSPSTMMSTIFLSAAYVFDLMAGDAAKVATIEKIGAISDNTKVTYDALKDMASSLRERAGNNVLPASGPTTIAWIDGVAVTMPTDPFYNTPWIPMRDIDGNGTTTPRSPLDSW
jgi:hypothetical protein